jgi:conjugative transfer signal peptidase TraF
MKDRQAIFLAMLAASALVLVAVRGRSAPLYLWNASASVPVGLYRLLLTSDRFAGELVAVRPPDDLAAFLADRHYLPRDVPMLKHVMALPRQTVCRLGRVVSVDGWVIGWAREHDSRNRPLPVWRGCRVIMADELFLMNPQSGDSLDGRYFGPLPRAAVIGRALPVWPRAER